MISEFGILEIEGFLETQSMNLEWSKTTTPFPSGNFWLYTRFTCNALADENEFEYITACLYTSHINTKYNLSYNISHLLYVTDFASGVLKLLFYY